MKALVKEKAEPGLWLVDVPEPAVGPGDVLIKVLRTGICGTDLHIRSWDGWARQAIRTPLVVGHEFVGEVVETGRDVTDIKAGDRVSGEGHLVCGNARNCLAGRRHLCRATVSLGAGRDGAFAEYVALPAANVWVHRVPVDLDVAAISTRSATPCTPRCRSPLVGEDVLITGAGPIGLMAAAVARHGARNVVVTDVSEQRLELARRSA
ncbi:L-threonine 3-dehydrogenase OS=Streptomyces alboniger OX=132473 GN=tdh PE=3 SV=1 [Streptomyces alboniger]